MERAKRNSVKKWDPDFVTSTPISSASKCVVAVDSAVSSLVDDDLNMVQDRVEEPAAKRPARKSCGTPEASDGPANSNRIEWRRARIPCSKMSCSKSGFSPTCFVDVTERCAHKTGWTCRWYHVSLGEHYCNDCFDYFYRVTKVGYKSVVEWKKNWLGQGCADPGIKQFFVDQYLPYWTQCNQCSKWRRVSKDTVFTSEFVASFVCSNECGVSGCEETEDGIVKAVKECDWLNLLQTPPLLINSPSAPFLVNYPPDSVGLSASSLYKSGITGRSSDVDGAEDNLNTCTSTVFIPTVKGVSEYLQPFSQPQVDIFYGSLPANRMTCNEQNHLPQYAREQPLYLSMRNVILALWAMNPKQVLTPKLCIQHFLCRGLARIHCAIELPAVLQYLTFNNYVNVGVISGCLFDVFPSLDLKTRVIVIGAGPAGLAAAHKLSKYGMQVTLLEARNRLGGRVSDEMYGDVCVGLGAQFINGCFNNPFALLALQTDCKLAEVYDRCCLINEAGELIATDVDSQLDCHFESMLERVSRWKDQSQPDCSLLDKLMELHKAFQVETNVSFQQAEENLFYFHIANVEHASGASLSRVSAKHWDHNEEFTQFDGPLCSLPSGYSKLLEKLATSLDTRLNLEVTRVSCGDNGVTVTTSSGQQFQSDRVIITVPLSLLKQRRIEFSPELPDWKLKAIDTLGVGMLEKVILSFERKFWANKVGGCDFFGRVPSQLASRGLFSVFHDVTSRSEVSSNTSVLVTFVSGDSTHIVNEKSDSEIVELCMESLRALFPEEKVPDPISYYVTHWQKDEFAAMSYSYTPVNCCGDVYDKLAASVSNQIYFAGEATNRAHPQTVTGAYLSGLRAADNILHPFIR